MRCLVARQLTQLSTQPQHLSLHKHINFPCLYVILTPETFKAQCGTQNVTGSTDNNHNTQHTCSAASLDRARAASLSSCLRDMRNSCGSTNPGSCACGSCCLLRLRTFSKSFNWSLHESAKLSPQYSSRSPPSPLAASLRLGGLACFTAEMVSKCGLKRARVVVEFFRRIPT